MKEKVSTSVVNAGKTMTVTAVSQHITPTIKMTAEEIPKGHRMMYPLPHLVGSMCQTLTATSSSMMLCKEK